MRLQRSFRIYVWDQVQSAHNSGICHSRNPTERLSESASDLDVWAFAVLFHFLLMSCHIFPSVQFRDHTDEVLRHMMVLQRKLLERLWLKWVDRGMYFDNDTRWVGDLENFPFCLVGRMFSIGSDRMDVA